MKTVAIPFIACGTPSMNGGKPWPVVYTRYEGGRSPDNMAAEGGREGEREREGGRGGMGRVEIKSLPNS